MIEIIYYRCTINYYMSEVEHLFIWLLFMACVYFVKTVANTLILSQCLSSLAFSLLLTLVLKWVSCWPLERMHCLEVFRFRILWTRARPSGVVQHKANPSRTLVITNGSCLLLRLKSNQTNILCLLSLLLVCVVSC